MPNTVYNQRFRLLQSDGTPYVLRKQNLTSMAFRYRDPDSTSTTQFTETFDYNLDEVSNYLWVKLPPKTLEWYVVINVSPLRTIQTALRTTTFAPGIETVEAFATPAPVNSLQGFSPYCDPTDHFWYEYSDELQTYVNTGVRAIDTTGEGHPIVDYIKEGVMSGVTSNAVAAMKTGYDTRIENIENNISTLTDHKVSVKVNGTTTEEDSEGLIDLGELSTEAYNSANTRMVTAKSETVNGITCPRGSLISTTGYGSEEAPVALSSNHYFYKIGANEDSWYNLFNMTVSCKIDVSIRVYNNIFGGTIFVQKNGYDFTVTTTSQYLADNIKVYKSGVSGYLVIKGNSHVSYNCDFECYDNILWLGRTTTLDEDQLTDMDVFMTSVQSEWANITASPYTVSASDLTVLNYNVVGINSVDFTFADTLDYPLTLRFVATEDDTVINVSDSTGTWTGTSSAMTKGQMGVFQFVTEDSYNWSYTVQKQYEEITNKVQEINSSNSASTTEYASLYAISKWTDEHAGGDKNARVYDLTLTKDEFGSQQDVSFTGGTVQVQLKGDFTTPTKGRSVILNLVNTNITSSSHCLLLIDNNMLSYSTLAPYMGFVKVNGSVVNIGSSLYLQYGSRVVLDVTTTSVSIVSNTSLSPMVKVNGKVYSSSASTEGIIDLGTIGGGKEADYDFTFTGTQTETTENEVDLTASQPRNNFFLKIDSSVDWSSSLTASPMLTISAYTYTNESLVIDINNESSGSTIGGAEYQVNNVAIRLYNYATSSYQLLSGLTTVASQKDNVFILVYDSDNSCWTVESTSTGDTNDYCKTLEVGNNSYSSSNGIITTPDYAKAVSSMTWLSATTSLHLNHINGNSENVSLEGLYDKYAKRSLANAYYTIPSTEGVDKQLNAFFVTQNKGKRFHKLTYVYFKEDGSMVDGTVSVQVRDDGTVNSYATGGLTWMTDGNTSFYFKLNTTAETYLWLFIDESAPMSYTSETYSSDVFVSFVVDNGDSYAIRGCLMGDSISHTYNFSEASSGTLTPINKSEGGYELDTDAGTLKMTDKDGNEQTLNISTIVITF